MPIKRKHIEADLQATRYRGVAEEFGDAEARVIRILNESSAQLVDAEERFDQPPLAAVRKQLEADPVIADALTASPRSFHSYVGVLTKLAMAELGWIPDPGRRGTVPKSLYFKKAQRYIPAANAP